MEGQGTETADERRQFGAALDMPAAAAATPPVTTARTPRPAPDLARAFEHEAEHGNLFLFVPVFMAIGALFYFTAAREPGLVPILLCALALGSLSLACRARPVAHAALVAATMTAVGMLAAKIETWRASTPMLGAEITTRMTGRVVQIEHQAAGRVRLTLDVLATERPQLRHAPDRVRASARSAPEALRPGDVVKGVVRLLPPSGPVRPQSYDFAFRSFFDGNGAVGFFLVDPQREAGDWPAPSPSMRAAAWIETWRQAMAARIERTVGGPEGAIAAALITGVRAGIPEEINEALRVTGLYHVISISGLHMALVAGTLMVALRCGFALAPGFSMRRPVKKYAALAALVATALYLLISGGDVAAQRSFLMLAVMLVAVLFDRAALTMRNLAISAIVILAVAPHEVMGPSFQMSFAATAALVAAYAAWSLHREARKAGPPPRRSALSSAFRAGARNAAGLSMTSIIAGLATALFTAWHFQQVSPMGLFANLAAMPVVSVVVMPMAVLATLAMPFGLDAGPLWLMGQGIAVMNAIAIWLAERSAFDRTGAIPLAAVLVLTASLAILTMAGSALRWAAAPLLAVGLALLVLLRAVPDVLVSEDARLVAMRLSDGRVAVNRARPRAFTMQNWLRAFRADETVRPVRASEGAAVERPFACTDGLCVARHGTGAILVHAPDEAAAATACAYASLIVIDDATAQDPCDGAVTVVGKRDLARRGSAAIMLGEENGVARVDLHFAISEPYRPWHEHRRFSREARGLPPWQRRDRPAGGAEAGGTDGGS